MIRSAMEFVAGLVRNEQRFEVVVDGWDTHEITYVEDGKRLFHSLPKPARPLLHDMETLESFIDFLLGPTVSDGLNTAVFLSLDRAEAVLDYGAQRPRSVIFGLSSSEEWMAMERLHQGVNQFDLWELLTTVLHGCISGSLLLQISGIRMCKNSEHNIRINPMGVTEERVGRAVSVAYVGKKGEETAEINLDWEWEGPLWKGIPEVYAQIPLRLSVREEHDELKFKLFPRDLNRIIDKKLVEVAEILRGALSIPVYLGAYDPKRVTHPNG